MTVTVEATDLGSAIDALDTQYPGFKDRLLDPQGQLRQFVNVYLNDEDVRTTRTSVSAPALRPR